MRRTVRLFVYAAAMLAVAVGVAAMLRDDPGYESGRSEISGKLVGLTEYQENRTEAGQMVAQKPSEEKAKAEPSAVQEQKAPAKEEAAPAVTTQEREDTGAPAEAQKAPAALEKSAEGEGAVSQNATPSPSEPVQAQPENESDVSSTERAEPEEKADDSARKPAESAQKEASVAADGNDPLPAASVSGEAKEDEAPKPSAAAEGKTEAPEGMSGEASGGSPAGQAIAEVRADLSGETPAEKPAEQPEKVEPKYERVVTSARFAMQGSQIKLILQGNAPMVGHYFTLENPDRVVLDLAGNWEVQVPKVPSNRLVRAVRVGHHEDKTRIVFDMKVQGKAALVPLNRNALELRIQ